MSNDTKHNWDEELSRKYLDYGRYFVPERELQMRVMMELLKGMGQPGCMLELCCGEGLLAEMILDELPGSTYLGMDGSSLMLEKAEQRLRRFCDRFRLVQFELSDLAWRRQDQPVQGVVSSLAIHHLDGTGKQVLFRDVYGMLAAGGAFVIADIIEPASSSGRSIAADALDETVRKRSIMLNGSTAALDFFLGEGWNTFRNFDPDDIDHPSPLLDQLKWLEQAGFQEVDVHFMQAGHALFSGWK